jgi:hypothetical protein
MESHHLGEDNRLLLYHYRHYGEGAVAVVTAWVLAVALEGRKVRRTEGMKEGRKKVHQ